MSLSINGKRLDDPTSIAIIAELSGNHGQDYGQAERLVAAAAEAGADFCKVQTFTPEEICADVPILFGYDAAHDAWCRKMGVSRLRELFAKGGFPRHWHKHLKKFAESCGIEFLSTPFSVDAARFLVEDVGVRALKIASGDLTFTPLLEYAIETQLPVIVSTGGAYLHEMEAVAQMFYEEEQQGNLVLLHCVSVYPCDEEIANLNALRTMQDISTLCEAAAYGFSDHTLSVELVPALAVSCGATCYEKHIRLEEDTTSVDAAHSLSSAQFARMVEVLRRVPKILGTGIKEPHPLEGHDQFWARRSPKDWKRPTEEARQGRWA